MRSRLVSSANEFVRNRFLLCRLASGGTRRLHRDSAAVQDTINNVLRLISDGKVTEAPQLNEVEAPQVMGEAFVAVPEL